LLSALRCFVVALLTDSTGIHWAMAGLEKPIGPPSTYADEKLIFCSVAILRGNHSVAENQA
jgi:hypothetical protein